MYFLFGLHGDFAVFQVEGEGVFRWGGGFLFCGGGAVVLTVPAHFCAALGAGSNEPDALFIAAVFFDIPKGGKAPGAQHDVFINKR